MKAGGKIGSPKSRGRGAASALGFYGFFDHPTWLHKQTGCNAQALSVITFKESHREPFEGNCFGCRSVKPAPALERSLGGADLQGEREEKDIRNGKRPTT